MILSRSLPRLLAVPAAVVLVFVAGCGSGSARSSVRGTVRYDGQPVDQGGIAFIPEGGASSEPRVRATAEISDGSYELDTRRGPYPGQYRVQIYWLKKTGKKVPAEKGHLKDETEQVMPARYNTKSELTAEIQPGDNTIPFDLKK